MAKTFGPLDTITTKSGRNWYQVIGVPRSSDAKTIRKVYIKAILAAHPDKHGGSDKVSLRSQPVRMALQSLIK